jgi:hypothetical protein
MNKYLFITLVFSHLCTYLLALAHSSKKQNTMRAPEPDISDGIIGTPLTAEMSEAMELLQNPSFRRLIAMQRLADTYGYEWVMVDPSKEKRPDDERTAA